MKSCYTCQFYGKCNVSTYKCKDWVKYSGGEVCLSVEGFNIAWLTANDIYIFRHFDHSIMRKRLSDNAEYLSGETVEKVIGDKESKIHDNSIEEIKHEKTERQ